MYKATMIFRKRKPESFFEDIVQTEIPIRHFKGKSPLFFRALSAMGGLFAADAKAVIKLLPAERGLRPLEPLPGRGLIGIACMEYTESDIGPYNEVALAIVVRGKPRPLLWIQELPVTTEIAVAGGVDYFGYPKYQALIEFRDSASHRSCTVLDSSSRELILEVEIRKPFKTWKRALRHTIHTRSFLGEQTLLGSLKMQALEWGLSPLPGAISLHVGTHARAQSFARLGIGPALGMLYVPRAQAIMNVETVARASMRSSQVAR